MEEHTLNLMPKAPSFYNFFCPSGLTYTHTHIRTHTQIHTCTFVEAQNTETGLLLKRNNDSVLGRKVIGLHGEPGKKSDVQCIYYA